MKKKIVTFMMLGIFILPILGTVVISDEKQILQSHLATQDWGIEIVVDGWGLGYKVMIGILMNETVTGDYTINISTDARFILVGRTLGYELINLTLDEPGFPIGPHLKPIIGFGPATINISINISLTDPVVDHYLFQKQIKGFLLFFYVYCPKTIFTIP